MRTNLTKRQTENTTKQFLTINEAAAFLDCCFSSMKKILQENKIAHRRIGRKYLISRAALEKWVEDGEGERE